MVHAVRSRDVDVEFYAVAGPLTKLSSEQADMIRGLALGTDDLCRVAQRLFVSPPDAAGAGLSVSRMEERNTRSAINLLQRVVELDPLTPLYEPRVPERRVVGTCRHFAVMATAFLRAVGTPARARCGFATYFVPPRKVDHWVVEHWSDPRQRWIRTDPEYLDLATPGSARTDDLRPGDFLTAGESWQMIRSGLADPTDFGVFGTENWGPGEVRGNAMRDLAAVARKIEMLPWDEWGPMQESYDGKTGADFDLLMDDLASVIDDPARGDELQRIYDQLAVPADMIC
jgi:Transglutaminase-like superfamily